MGESQSEARADYQGPMIAEDRAPEICEVTPVWRPSRVGQSASNHRAVLRDRAQNHNIRTLHFIDTSETSEQRGKLDRVRLK